jgi:hypothetical protein
MRVKIGNKIIDANDEPIMLIFEDDNELLGVINNLVNMGKNEGKIRKYMTYPDNMDIDDVKQFMVI